MESIASRGDRSMLVEKEVVPGLGGSSGMIVLLLKQVHLQNDVGAISDRQ